MRTISHCTGLVALSGVVAFVMSGAAMAQTVESASSASADGQVEFRDESTGKVWTPSSVSQDGKPIKEADRAFDPRAQVTSGDTIIVRNPNMHIMGLVAPTAGPNVPIVSVDHPMLKAIPGRNWITAVYVTNNSAAPIAPVLGCQITNGGQAVEQYQVHLTTIAPGERWGVSIAGPPTDVFVDQMTCRVLTPG
jgi:hypothetical protein